MSAAPAPAPKRAAALPSVPIKSRDFKYRSAAKTDVTLTLDAARKRVGALTGAQVREARRKAERGVTVVVPDTHTGTTVFAITATTSPRKARP